MKLGHQPSDRYPNLVARSFSRVGVWLDAGRLRCNWHWLKERKIDMPFDIIDPAAAAACAALGQPDFLVRSRKKVAQVKQQVKQSLTCLKMSHSQGTTPIMTLTAPDPAINLRQQFLRQGVLVVDGAEFPGLTSASVRLDVCDGAALVQATSCGTRSLRWSRFL